MTDTDEKKFSAATDQSEPDSNIAEETSAAKVADASYVGSGYAKYVLVILTIVYVFNFVDRQIISILAEEIKTDMNVTDAEGVGVIIEARHMCMMMRGVEKQNSVMKTSAMLGSFRDSQATREEFLQLLQMRI